MIHVKNSIHGMRTKWMHHLCRDAGSSSSRFIWPRLAGIIPSSLWTGMHSVSESLAAQIPQFYATIVCSYSYVNNLFYENALNPVELPHNLWSNSVFSDVNALWCQVGFCTVPDLLVDDGKINVPAVTQALRQVGCFQSPYL